MPVEPVDMQIDNRHIESERLAAFDLPHGNGRLRPGGREHGDGIGGQRQPAAQRVRLDQS